MKKVILIILALAAVVAMLSYTAFSHSQQLTPAATAEPTAEPVPAAVTAAPVTPTPGPTEPPEGPMPGLGDFEPLEVVDEMEIELEPDQDLAYAGG